MEVVDREKWKKALALAKKGDAESQWFVAYHYEFGAEDESGVRLVKADPLNALHWCELSAAQGYSSGQLALSRLLSGRSGIPADYEAAIYWAHQAMEQGDSGGAWNLATIYRDLKKPATSFKWYERAAAAGDNQAVLEIGLCCLFGFGTKQDLGRAYECLRKVAAVNTRFVSQRGQENALYWLAVLNLMGVGAGRRSVARARQMLEIANADNDHEQANLVLNVIGKSRLLAALGTASRKAGKSRRA